MWEIPWWCVCGSMCMCVKERKCVSGGRRRRRKSRRRRKKKKREKLKIQVWRCNESINWQTLKLKASSPDMEGWQWIAATSNVPALCEELYIYVIMESSQPHKMGITIAICSQAKELRPGEIQQLAKGYTAVLNLRSDARVLHRYYITQPFLFSLWPSGWSPVWEAQEGVMPGRQSESSAYSCLEGRIHSEKAFASALILAQ